MRSGKEETPLHQTSVFLNTSTEINKVQWLVYCKRCGCERGAGGGVRRAATAQVMYRLAFTTTPDGGLARRMSKLVTA